MNPNVEIDGRPPGADPRWILALASYGHFTAMQVRGGRTRGLDLHLTRLDAATRELFDRQLDGDRVRGYVRHALGDDVADASVRVCVFSVDENAEPSVMVTVLPPFELPETRQRLRSVEYQRPVAHLKHSGGFARAYHRRRAQRDGYDEVLLIGADGVISEGGITNLGCWDGSTVLWPDAPALAGITMQLLERRFTERAIPSRHQRVHIRDLASFEGVFVTNSHGVAAVERVDDQVLPVAPGFMKTLVEIYQSAPWDQI